MDGEIEKEPKQSPHREPAASYGKIVPQTNGTQDPEFTSNLCLTFMSSFHVPRARLPHLHTHIKFPMRQNLLGLIGWD